MTGIRDALGRLWRAGDSAPMIQQGDAWTPWGDVRRLAEMIDATLSAAGCGAGSRVGVVLGNRAESIAALIAILGHERTLVTLNPMQPVARLASDIVNSRPPVVLATQYLWDDARFVGAVSTVGAAGFAVDNSSVTAVVNESDGTGAPVTTAEPTEPVAVEMFTSGTTGPPKRIPLTWRQLESAMTAVHTHTGATGPEREPLTGRVALVTLPIVHIGGLWGVLQNLAEGRPFVLLPRFTVEGWVSAVREHRPKIAGLPPTAMRGVLAANVPVDDLSSLRAVTAGTTLVPPDLADEFTARYGIPVLIMYGATEFSGAIAGWTKPLHSEWWQRKRGSVGKAFPGVELRTVDDGGEPLPLGETGRIEVRSGQTDSGAGGWMRTSDLGHLDDDGFLWIDGRADDAIIRGGFKVHPEVVADALRAHESVLDAVVFGREDDRLGAVPVAAVELVAGAREVAEDELKDFCRKQLTAYEVPVRIHIVGELPRSASLKVDRRQLLDLVAAADASTEHAAAVRQVVGGQS